MRKQEIARQYSAEQIDAMSDAAYAALAGETGYGGYSAAEKRDVARERIAARELAYRIAERAANPRDREAEAAADFAAIAGAKKALGY